MQADLPHTLYPHGGKSTRNGKNRPASEKSFKYDPNDPAIKLQEEANRRRRERKAAEAAAKERGEIPMTTEELFRQK